MPATILFIRHAENPANLTGQLSHRDVDLSLTERGRRQAQAVAQHLANGNEGSVDALFSSPLRRARETAAVIGFVLGLEIEVLEELRELNVGELEGRSDDDAWRIHDEIDAAWVSGRAEGTFPGGEDLPTALGRFGGALRTIVERVGQGRAVVVGHGGLMRIGAANLFRDPATEPITDPIANASIIEMELALDGGAVRGRVLGWARGDHLAAVG
ncbi:MAG: histidine phosphatase family protein [Candidatus Limnocylindria bacterium]